MMHELCPSVNFYLSFALNTCMQYLPYHMENDFLKDFYTEDLKAFKNIFKEKELELEGCTSKTKPEFFSKEQLLVCTGIKLHVHCIIINCKIEERSEQSLCIIL